MRSLISRLIGLALLGPGLLAQEQVGWEVGDSLPELELPTIDGSKTIRLSDFKGERMLLIQFASW